MKVAGVLERITQQILDVGETQRAAEALFGLGRLRADQQDLAGMTDSLLRAADLYSSLGMTYFEAKAYLALGSGHRNLGEAEDALRFMIRSAELYTQAGLPRQVAVTFREIESLLERAAPKTAAQSRARVIEVWAEAIELYERLGEPLLTARAYLGLGETYVAIGRTGDSIIAFETSARLFLGLEMPADLATVEAKLAQAYLDQGELGKAVNLFKSAARLYAALGRFQDATLAMQEIDSALQHQSPDIIFQMWLENAEVFRRAGNRTLAAGVLYQLGIAYRDQGRNQESIQVLQESLELYKSLELAEGLADSTFQLARSHEESGSTGQAATLYGRSALLYAVLARGQHDVERSADQALGHLARVSGGAEDLGFIRQVYQLIIDESRGTAPLNVTAEALFRIALTYVQSGELTKSKEVFEDSLTLYPENPSTRLGADALFRLGLTYQALGRLDDARRLIDISVQDLARAESGDHAAEALNYILTVPSELQMVRDFYLQLGQGYMDQEDSWRSLTSLEVAVDSFAKAGQPEGVIAALTLKSQAYLALEEVPKAADALKESAVVADDADLAQAVATSFAKLQDLWEQTAGREKTAKNWAAEAERYEESGRSGPAARSLYYLGQTFRDLGRGSESIQALERAVQIFEAIPQETGLAESLFELAQTYHSLNDFENAIKFFSDSSQLFEGLNLPQGLADSLLQLGLTYLESGKTDDSIQPLGKSVQHYIDLTQPMKAAAAMSALENAQERLGISESTGRLWERIGELSRESDLLEPAASSFYMAAQAHRDFGDFREAASSFEKSATIYGNLREDGSAFESLVNLVLSLEAANDPDNTWLALHRTAAAFEESGLPNLAAETLFRLSLAEVKYGQLEKAVEASAASLQFYPTLDLHRLELGLLFRVGLTYNILGEYETSAEAFELSIDQILLANPGGARDTAERLLYIYTINADSVVMADFLLTLGQRQINQGTPDEALKPLRVSADIYANIGQSGREAEARRLLSQVS